VDAPGGQLKRTTQVALGGVVVLVAAVGFWLLGRPGRAARDDPVATTPTQVAYPPAFYEDAVVRSDTASAAPPTDTSTGREAVELCGQGIVNESRMPAGLEQAADDAILRASAALEASREERQQAIGLSLRAMATALRASARAADWDAQNCFVTDMCDAATKQAQHSAAAPAAEALARLATRTLDARTYALALRVCRFIDTSASAACTDLTPEQWARLDPDNGFAWLEVAAAARKRRDFAANDAALRQASRSTLIDWRATPYDEFLAHIETTSDPVRTLVLSLLSTAYFSEERFAEYTGLAHYCGLANSQSDRREVCQDLGQLLVDKDPGPTGMEAGDLIAMFAGIKLKAPATGANLAVARALAIPSADPLSCDWAEQATKWLQGASKYGERGYLTRLQKERPQSSPAATEAPMQR
jgi:hypothetical protein